jgi:hypothetical protein
MNDRLVFFKRYKSLAKLTKRRRSSKLIKLELKKHNITPNTSEIQRITGEYFETLHCNNLEHLEEMANF